MLAVLLSHRRAIVTLAIARIQQRLDRRAERVADGVERIIDATSQSAHAGGCTEGDESNDERVFHQILTLLAMGQILKFNVELEKQAIHFLTLRQLGSFPTPAGKVEVYPLVLGVRTTRELWHEAEGTDTAGAQVMPSC